MNENHKAFKSENDFLADLINRHACGAKSVVMYEKIGHKVSHIGIAIDRVIFNDPATIVFWSDGSKTVVKCEYEAFDPEKGLSMAIAKRAFGNQGSYYNIFKKWMPEQAVLYADNKPIVKFFVKDGD